jgi:hypothetical protein
MAFFRSCFLRGVLGAFIILLAAAIAVPQYGDYKERAANAAIFDESLALRQSIEVRIQALGTVENSGFGIKVPDDRNYKADVTRDGTVILQGLRYGHVLVLTPSLDQGVVSWSCMGGPPKDMHLQCKGT